MAFSPAFSCQALNILGLLVMFTCTVSLDAKDKSVPFHVTLKHVDAHQNLGTFELIRRGIQRTQLRLQKVHTKNGQVLLSLLSSSPLALEAMAHLGDGEFLMDLSIGGPSGNFTAVMDTGSDLTWTQCKPCIECFDQPTPIFDPTHSHSYENLSCFSDLCQAMSPSVTSCGRNGTCHYLYSYGDTSSSEGTLALDNFWFGNVSTPKMVFGCGHENSGIGFSHTAGLVGLARGPLSFISQLGKPEFSYCLPSVLETADTTGKFFIGSLDHFNISSDTNQKKITPIVKNPQQPTFYYVTLEAITVGDKRIDLYKTQFEIDENGDGGLIMDSGTTITYLHGNAFQLVANEFKRQVNLTAIDVESSQINFGLELCFGAPEVQNESRTYEIPKLVFHFDRADLELPEENYIGSHAGLVCVLMGTSPISMSIFGNIQQQNMLITYNLGNETLSFLPMKCNELLKV